MADYQNRSRYASDENWDQNQGGYGTNDWQNQSPQNRGSYGSSNYGASNSGYGGNQYNDYSQGMGQQGYGAYGSTYGANRGGTGYGNREDDGNRSNRNRGGYNSNFGSQGESGSYGQGYDTSGGYGTGYNRGNYNQGTSGAHGYSGSRRYGNEQRGGSDRDWWERARNKVSSWFGDIEAEGRRQMEKMIGPHRGKGPKGYARSDERIREDVCDRLADSPTIDASDVEVSVNGSGVILTGTVDSREAKRRAEDLAESVLGVTNVQNQLRVSQTHSGTNNRGNY